VSEQDKRKQALDALVKFGELQQDAEAAYNIECDKFWDELDYETKLKAFYSVCKRIHQGDVKDRGSYRYVLYDVFNFDLDSYGIGMSCGYMDIHNAIFDGIEFLEDGK
jgi:hypothetical protein